MHTHLVPAFVLDLIVPGSAEPDHSRLFGSLVCQIVEVLAGSELSFHFLSGFNKEIILWGSFSTSVVLLI